MKHLPPALCTRESDRYMGIFSRSILAVLIEEIRMLLAPVLPAGHLRSMYFNIQDTSPDEDIHSDGRGSCSQCDFKLATDDKPRFSISWELVAGELVCQDELRKPRSLSYLVCDWGP